MKCGRSLVMETFETFFDKKRRRSRRARKHAEIDMIVRTFGFAPTEIEKTDACVKEEVRRYHFAPYIVEWGMIQVPRSGEWKTWFLVRQGKSYIQVMHSCWSSCQAIQWDVRYGGGVLALLSPELRAMLPPTKTTMPQKKALNLIYQIIRWFLECVVRNTVPLMSN